MATAYDAGEKSESVRCIGATFTTNVSTDSVRGQHALELLEARLLAQDLDTAWEFVLRHGMMLRL